MNITAPYSGLQPGQYSWGMPPITPGYHPPANSFLPDISGFGAQTAPTWPIVSAAQAGSTGISGPGQVAPKPKTTTETEVPGFWEGTLANEGQWKNGLNLGSLGTLVEGIGSLGSLYTAFQANKIAKDSLAFQKESFAKNLANSISSYNMALEDRAHARAKQYGDSTASAERYISRHRLEA